MRRGKKKSIFSTIMSIIVIIILFNIYQKYDFNFYYKGVSELGKAIFERDKKETTNGKRSYKINNKDYTDAMFYRKISVEPNSAYKVSCMVKTEDVEQLDGNSVAGAQITLKNYEEHSDIISGTTDWTKLEFCFNSKNEDSIEIGFQLGGNGDAKAKGTAWFSDISLEKGVAPEENTWKIACFIIRGTDVTLDDGISIDEYIRDIELSKIERNIKRFENSLEAFSKGKIKAECEMYDIDQSLTSLTFDEDNGYYVSEKDIYKLINSYVKENEFDHIFICFKIPSEDKLTTHDVTNWVGLGNMQYCGKGMSNIRILDNDYYDDFPEEVYIHEFLHTLERNATELGYEIPALHDIEKYGYDGNKSLSSKQWYMDYMNKEIETSDGEEIGLPEEIFTFKPVQLSNFEYAIKLDYLNEPKNIPEAINCAAIQIRNIFDKKEEERQIQFISN